MGGNWRVVVEGQIGGLWTMKVKTCVELAVNQVEVCLFC